MPPKSEGFPKFVSVLDLSKQSSKKYEYSKYNDENSPSFLPQQSSKVLNFISYDDMVGSKSRVLDLSLSSKKDLPFDSPLSSSSPPLQSPTIAASETYPSLFKSETKIFKCDSKTEDYYERRRKNNISAKKSRDMKKKREVQQKEKLLSLEEENRKLKQKLAYCVCHKLTFYNACGAMPMTDNYKIK